MLIPFRYQDTNVAVVTTLTWNKLYSPAQWYPCSCILHGGLGRSNPQKPREKRREICSVLRITTGTI